MLRDESDSDANSIVRVSAPLRLPLGTLVVCATSILAMKAGHADTGASDQPNSDDSDRKLEEVAIDGVRPMLHDKLPQDLQDTPQSITVVGQKLISDQGATRLEDALKNVPGITLNAGEGAARGDTVNLRGFSAFNDFFLDGIRDAAVYSRDSFDLQEVEVIKGPSAVLFGRGSTGGAINQVSKAPLATALFSVTANVGSYRATSDINLPLTSSIAVRINAMGENSEVADRDDVINRRWGIAPALTFSLGESDSLTLAYLHQQEDNRPDAGIPFVNGEPAAVPRDAYYGLVSDRATTDVDIGTARFKHDFSPDLSIADTLRYAHYTYDFIDNMPNSAPTSPRPTRRWALSWSVAIRQAVPGSRVI